jgi:hypothetical protein
MHHGGDAFDVKVIEVRVCEWIKGRREGIMGGREGESSTCGVGVRERELKRVNERESERRKRARERARVRVRENERASERSRERQRDRET